MSLHKLLSTAFLMLVSLMAIPASGKAVSEKEVEDLLDRLDHELSKRDNYIAGRRTYIDSLKRVAMSADTADTLYTSALMSIGDNYSAFNIDSALWFYNKGFNTSHAQGNDYMALRFALRKEKILPLLLFFELSRKLTDSINALEVPAQLEAERVEAERQMHFFTANFFTEYPAVYDSIMNLHHDAQARLLTLLPKDTNTYRLHEAEHYFHRREYTKAMVILNELLESTDETDPLFARASHLLAEISIVNGDDLGRLYNLALSAISDTRCSTLEVTSLQELGKALYERGDIERAHSYLAIALNNAVDCHAALRIIQTSQSIPLIENAHKGQLTASRMRLYAVIVILVLLLIFLAIAIRLVKNRNHQLDILTKRLTGAGKTKDVYIAQFLNLCSIYMDKLNQFNKIVNSKISAGKADDLLKLTKSGKFIEEQSKEFYEVFDDAFLHLYPTFVADVNELLQPDKRIELRDNEKLNTDLRILALMRLGVVDSSRIAQMLNYSVYTIYTYRNKFKARAINRDTFESEVRSIRSAPTESDAKS
ncbi:MAG: DUF6377 domain-containing protein [Muribaculaceae bacterium]|nr:DUF6377 domain-containing protein [Muribaculaceae bacterium]